MNGLRKGEPASPAPSPGFIILDSTMNPIVVNRTAAEILSFPDKPRAVNRLDRLVVSRIRSLLLSDQDDNDALAVADFQSGRRSYSVRLFRLDSYRNGCGGMSVAILLERRASDAVSILRAATQYHLTVREQEVLHFLFEGLTSKEIAVRMDISANTVKAFLRFIMIKTGVTTRSGIVGRTVSSRA